MGLPDLATWRVESLRLTVFFGLPVIANGLGWWKKVTGQEPESAINRPQAGEYSEVGQFLDGQLEMKVAFNRADWVLSYPFSGMPGAPNPGELPQLSNSFVDSLANVLSNMNDPVVRLAYGLVAFHTVESISQGNDIVANLLPFVRFDSDVESSDLLIQVNNPSVSDAVSGLDLNRISKLGVVTRQVVQVGPSGIPTMEADQVVRAEYDISSAVDRVTPVESKYIASLATEMKNVAESILSSGVVR